MLLKICYFLFGQSDILPLLYVALNVSCPNTVDGIVEETSLVSSVVEQISKENTAKLPTIFLKLSPDSSDELIREND